MEVQCLQVDSDSHSLYSKHNFFTVARLTKPASIGANTTIYATKLGICKSKSPKTQTKHTDGKGHSNATHWHLSHPSGKEFDNHHVLVHKTSRPCSEKLTTVLTINGVDIKVEIDTGAELSTILLALYKEKLSHSHCSHQSSAYTSMMALHCQQKVKFTSWTVVGWHSITHKMCSITMHSTRYFGAGVPRSFQGGVGIATRHWSWDWDKTWYLDKVS